MEARTWSGRRLRLSLRLRCALAAARMLGDLFDELRLLLRADEQRVAGIHDDQTLDAGGGDRAAGGAVDQGVAGAHLEVTLRREPDDGVAELVGCVECGDLRPAADVVPANG